MITLSNLTRTVYKHKKRVGRGEGSNRGKNSGKGHKGQNKHGKGVRIGFEGGQTMLIRRMPKFRGFKKAPRRDLATLNLGVINHRFNEGEEVSVATLFDKGLITKFVKKVRIINSGSLDKKIAFSTVGDIYLTKGVKSILNL